METQTNRIDIDAVELDCPARIYEGFLRSLRILRALVGASVGTAIITPTLIFWSFYGYGFTWFALLVGLSTTFVFLVLVTFMLMIFFYLFRSVAAGSLRTTRCVVAITCLFLMSDVLNLGYFVFELTAAPPVLALIGLIMFIMLAELMTIYALYLLLIGLVRFISSRHEPFYQLLQDQKYNRKFWPGWPAFLRSFWLMMGIPVPPRPAKMAKRVTLAALCAFSLEGMAIAYYIDTSGRVTANYEKHHEVFVRAAADSGYMKDVDKIAFSLFALVIPIIVPLSLWGMFALSRKLRRYARRRALLSADAAMLMDPRNPVLFLRSFSDDQISFSEAKVPWLMRFFDPGVVVGTLDELLVTECAEVGPVIAIGRPSDRLPPIGAARQYCQGTEWEEIVRKLMQRSALIVVGMGRSHGLEWEIATIRSLNVLAKTVFVFPPSLAKQRLLLHDLFISLGLSETLCEFRSDQAVLFVSFLATQGPLLLLTSRITELEYEIGLRAAKQPDIVLTAQNHHTEAHSRPLARYVEHVAVD